ncbi:MAG: hypothetical protein KAJ51_17075, partial [Thermoplasmata archaeon]|nr:hypothetical protein [Thermoplasmata archaeon]
QEFEVEVVEIIDDAELKIPRWLAMPDCILEEDHPGVNNWAFLPNYIRDYDDDTKDLDYSIVSISNNGYLEVAIDSENYIDITPLENFDGTSEVVLKAMDNDGNYGIGNFYIKMLPSNDPPIMEFLEPAVGAVITGRVLIQGTGVDIEGSSVTMELMLGEGSEWLELDNTEGHWLYLFDTIEYKERTQITLLARGFDGELYSENATLDIIIDNTLKDSDGDGRSDAVDEFPYDPLEWLDADYDEVGDNADEFDRDPTQWSDQDGDGYGDNPKGKGYDAFPLDPTQHRDKDGDGYGDNPDGNNPDYDPDDSNVQTKDDLEQDDEGIFASFQNRVGPLLPVWIFVIILIIIDVYLITYLYMARTGKLAARRAAKEQKQKEAAAAAAEAEMARQLQEKVDKGEVSDTARKAYELEKTKHPEAMSRPVVIFPDKMGKGGFGPAAGVPPIPGLTIPSVPMPGQGQPYPGPPGVTAGGGMAGGKQPYGVYKGQGKPGQPQVSGPPFFPLLPGYQPPPRPVPGQRPMLLPKPPVNNAP